jgi:hypothetical protein
MWVNVEHYHNTHSTQYRCTHYTLLSTDWCFQSVCSSVTRCCVTLFSTNSSPVVPQPANVPPNRTRTPPPAGTFSWNADCIRVSHCQLVNRPHETRILQTMKSLNSCFCYHFVFIDLRVCWALRLQDKSFRYLHRFLLHSELRELVYS